MRSPPASSHFVPPFLLNALLVLSARLPDAFNFGYLRNRHIPPGFITRHTHFLIHLDDDHAGAVVTPHIIESALEFVVGSRAHGARTEPGAQTGEIARHVTAIELVRILSA